MADWIARVVTDALRTLDSFSWSGAACGHTSVTVAACVRDQATCEVPKLERPTSCAVSGGAVASRRSGWRGRVRTWAPGRLVGTARSLWFLGCSRNRVGVCGMYAVWGSLGGSERPALEGKNPDDVTRSMAAAFAGEHDAVRSPSADWQQCGGGGSRSGRVRSFASSLGRGPAAIGVPARHGRERVQRASSAESS